MGLFDRSALPDHLDEQHEIEGAFPDDDEHGPVIRWLKKQTKHWLAFGPRSPNGVALMVAPIALILWAIGNVAFDWHWTYWALWPICPVFRKWRPKPFVIFAMCGAGSWRLEKLSGGDASAPRQFLWMTDLEGEYYFSRVQPWTQWHLALLWPLSIQFRVFFKAKDVVPTGEHRDTDGQSFFTYLFSHFDADWVFWAPSGYVGLNSK